MEKILERLRRKDFLGLNIKKIKERDDIFRVRKGNIRIIYRLAPKGEVFILSIERRSEKTYRDFFR